MAEPTEADRTPRRQAINELDTEASECRDLGRRYREGDKWTGAAVCDAKSWTSKDAAARIRAAVNEVTT